MTRRFRQLTPHLTVALFALIVATPLARGMGTCTDDAFQHITRAIEIERLIRLGHLFPRWAPDLAHGFGYPLFNYYAPLSAYVVVLFHLLGFNFSVALHLTYFVALLASGLATFALARDLWGTRAGLVAAVGYLSAPYFAFDILFRGALAETFAWIWPPLIMWAILRAHLAYRVSPMAYRVPRIAYHVSRFTPRVSRFTFRVPSFFFLPPSFFLAAAAYTALILTHNIVAMLASPLLVAFVLLLAWERRGSRALLHGAAVLLGGLALSAYFWLPALAEKNLVRTDRLLVPPIFTYYTNWLTPRELLAPPLADDPLLLNPSPAKTLGLIPTLLALPALAGLARRKFRPHWPRVTFFAAALAVYALLTLPLSGFLWDHLPLLPLAQFPWRTLSLAALCAALLAGAAVKAFEEIAAPLTLLLGAGLLLANLPWWYPRYCAPLEEHDVAATIRFEYATGTIGASAKGEFLPVTVPTFPTDDTLAETIFAGKIPDRIDRASLPPDGAYTYLNRDPLATRFSIVGGAPYTLVYKAFYFPGWRVLVDGDPVPIKITPDHGLISFDMTPGEHLVVIRLGLTRIRLLASTISVLALAAFLALARISPRTPTPGPGASLHPAYLLLPLTLLILKLAWFDRFPNPLRHTRFDGQAVSVAQHPLRADYAGGVTLFGYDLSRSTAPSGEALDISLYAGVRQPVETRYWPTFSLEDQLGQLWSARDQNVPRWHREPPHTPLWPTLPDGYAQWSRQLQVLPGTPPGLYQLWAIIFDVDSRSPDSILDKAGNPVAPRLLLGEIEITRPSQPAADIEMQHPLNRPLSPSLTLLGYDLDRAEARPGEAMLLTAYWQAAAPPIGEVLQIRLVGENGETTWEVDPLPGFPGKAWQSGDVWRGPHLLVLPADLRSGDYRFELGINEGQAVGLAGLRIEAPPHLFERPAVQVELNVQVGDLARLIGYNLEGATVTLVWQALRETRTSYASFVHLADEAGHNRAQSDGIPAGTTRPTTGWLPGEYILDPHPLALPADLLPGDYPLYAGLYDPRTGERLPTEEPDGRVRLGTLEQP